jgi:hypothetical protein
LRWTETLLREGGLRCSKSTSAAGGTETKLDHRTPTPPPVENLKNKRALQNKAHHITEHLRERPLRKNTGNNKQTMLSSRGVGGVGLTQIRRVQLLGRAVPWRAPPRQTLLRQQALLGQGSDRQERARLPPRNFEEFQRQFLCEIKQVCWAGVHLTRTYTWRTLVTETASRSSSAAPLLPP